MPCQAVSTSAQLGTAWHGSAYKLSSLAVPDAFRSRAARLSTAKLQLINQAEMSCVVPTQTLFCLLRDTGLAFFLVLLGNYRQRLPGTARLYKPKLYRTELIKYASMAGYGTTYKLRLSEGRSYLRKVYHANRLIKVFSHIIP